MNETISEPSCLVKQAALLLLQVEQLLLAQLSRSICDIGAHRAKQTNPVIFPGNRL